MNCLSCQNFLLDSLYGISNVEEEQGDDHEHDQIM
jgi:hypothetical protein